MKKTTAASVVALGLVLVGGNVAPQLGFGIAPAAAQQTKGKTPPLNPKIGKPLQEVQALINQKNFKGAIAKLDEVEQMPGKSPYETYLVNLFGLNAYIGLQDWAGAAKSLEAMLNSGQTPPEEVSTKTKVLVQAYYSAKNYPKAIEWGQKYNKEAQDPEIQALIGQSYLIQKNDKGAAEAMKQALKFADAKGTAPKEEWLQVLETAEYNQQNTPGLQYALEQLVQRYSKAEYWRDLLNVVEKNLGGGNSKTILDVYRLKLATGNLKDPNEYMEMSETAIQQGLPGEAKKVVEKGIQSGVLANQKDRAQRLLNMATTQAATDQKQLDAGLAEAAKQATGDAEVKFGEAYWSYGMNDKAIAEIQHGISKGVKDKDDAQLRLGLAYIAAGKRSQALDAFKQITPNTSAAQLAHLWALQSGTRQASAD